MSTIIKKAFFEEDYNFIVDNVMAFYQENPKEIFLSTREKIEKGIKQLFKDKDNFYYVIYSKNNKIGLIQIMKTEYNVGEIILIYLKEKYRNKGLGEKALEEALSDAKKNNIKSFKTEINTFNEHSKHFFKKQNFKKHSSIYLLN